MANPRKRRNQKREGMDESWLLPYADMLTLLLALFIVLFAMSSLDAIKFRDLAQSLSGVLSSGSGVMDYPSLEEQIILEEQSTEPESKINELAAMAELEDLVAMQARIDEYIRDNGLSNRLSTNLTGEGLQITILDNALFDSGSAEIKPGAQQLGTEISKLIVSDPPRHVTISGHTDNVPISTAQYSSNWHLSVMRAINFMEVLMKNDELKPDHLSAKGYGEYQPIAPNDTADNRAKNRRVEVLVTPNYELSLD